MDDKKTPTTLDEVFARLSELIAACTENVRSGKRIDLRVPRFRFKYRRWENGETQFDFKVGRF